MLKTLKIVNVVGARPNFMKIAPLMKAYRQYTHIRSVLVHTGQHYDGSMSDVFFEELGIPTPDVFLGVGSGTHAQQTARVMLAFEPLLIEQKPDLVVVVGDVNSTVAATLVATKLLIPVAHVEAGLRSFDRTMPEEINRVVTDSLSDFLFTTSEDANENLRREGILEEKIHFVGNTMIDTLLALSKHDAFDTLKRKLSLSARDYAYVTMHRPSNVDDKEVLQGICDALICLQERITIVWPLHPRTRKMLEQFSLYDYVASQSKIRLTDPLGYLESLSLMRHAKFVLTDSGGIQEETTAIGVPCLTLRNNTERPITIHEGTNELVGNAPHRIIERAMALLSGTPKTGRMPKLWDGHAAERIARVLVQKFR